MVKSKIIATTVIMVLLTMIAVAQPTPEVYNPFIPANLDDTAKLQVSPVVESSYHRYWVAGDVNYTDPSTFVWYVSSGVFGTFDTLTEAWSPLATTFALGTGTGAYLTGTTVGGIRNSSEVWVRWNDGSGGNIGYVAVYERSADSCIVDDQLTGFKHTIVNAPEIWFLTASQEVCSNDSFPVVMQFNNVNNYSFPYRVSISYPNNLGAIVDTLLYINQTDLNQFLSYTVVLPAVQDLNVSVDESYNITLVSLKDRYSSTGFIAPGGAGAGQYASVNLQVNHLPQTDYMAMDGQPVTIPAPGLVPVEIPDPGWVLDSVVNSSVHYYAVQGDRNYAVPSTFVWTVSGGRLFYDQQLTNMAGNGTTAVVDGMSNNVTDLWVVWDSFDTPLDTGYIYVYEISADGCQRSDLDPAKFRGMRIKVSSPPDARFISPETIVCSNFDSTRVIMEIEGMPPYDLAYTINGERFDRHLTAADMADWDGDGEADNISFVHTGFSNIVSDEVYVYEIIEVSSGGVAGHILDSPTHTVIAHVQPPAPDILPEWTEATTGTPNVYTYRLLDQGVSPAHWFWSLRDNSTNLKNSYDSETSSTFPCVFDNNMPPGLYYLEANYVDTYGCISPFDTMNIELFGLPTIAFSGNDTIINCSESSLVPDNGEIFEFVVEYYGARTYGFTYEVYDYNGNRVDGGIFNDQTNRTNIITIQNRFINDELPEEIRPWRVKIISAHNEEPGVNVNILDSDIAGGRDERVILIYPKPLIHDDIDFAN